MFLMWWLMMIAMMLPSAAPVALLHAGLTRQGLARTEPDAPAHRLLAATSAFIAGYLVMWGAFSLVAAIAQWALERAGLLSAMMMSTSGLLGAGLLLAAGVWQLTPLKAACLRHCRSPLSFLSGNWRPGIGGAFRMGAVHGTYCLGCCWFLMALMFYAGVMNLIWTIGLALFVVWRSGESADSCSSPQARGSASLPSDDSVWPAKRATAGLIRPCPDNLVTDRRLVRMRNSPPATFLHQH
jgi:predicted metal-binding membrane protein